MNKERHKDLINDFFLRCSRHKINYCRELNKHCRDGKSHHMLCDAQTVSEQDGGTAAIFLYYSLSSFSPFSSFSSCLFVTLTAISFLGCLDNF